MNPKKTFQGSSLAPTPAPSKALDGPSHVWTGSYVLCKICTWLRLLLSLSVLNPLPPHFPWCSGDVRIVLDIFGDPEEI